MIYHGRNLIVSANGKVIAAAKSCDLDVECEEIPVSSSTDGQYKHVIAGLKSWKIGCNHLLGMDVVPSHTILAVGTSNNNVNMPSSYCIINGIRYSGGTRGLQLRAFEWGTNGWTSKYNYQYDTYASEQAIGNMISDLDNDLDSGDLTIITSFDAYAITDTLATALMYHLDLPDGSVPVVAASRASFVCIAVKGQGGVTFTNTNPGSSVHATLLLDVNRNLLSQTPIKSAAQMVGTQVTLSLQADGIADDRLTGKALVRTWKATGAIGNLANGGFSFVGNGPLE